MSKKTKKSLQGLRQSSEASGIDQVLIEDDMHNEEDRKFPCNDRSQFMTKRPIPVAPAYRSKIVNTGTK